jgi:hypothetical protein
VLRNFRQQRLMRSKIAIARKYRHVGDGAENFHLTERSGHTI